MTSRRTALVAAFFLLALAAPAEATRLYAVTENPRQVLGFDSAAPGTILSTANITGLQAANEVIEGVDLRAASGELILLTRQTGGTGRMYRLDPTTGIASQATTLSAILPNSDFGVDVDPVENNLRVIAADESNRTVNLTTGAITGDLDGVDTGYTLDGLGYQADGDVFAFDTAASGLFSLPTGTDEDDNDFGPGSDLSGQLDTDPAQGVNTALDLKGDTAFLTAVDQGDGLQHLFVDPDSSSGPAYADAGVVGGGALDLRGLAAVDNLVRFPATAITTEEGEPTALTVSREAAVGSSTVNWTTQAGTASAGSDFSTLSGSVTFAPGEGAKTLTIGIPEDTADEPAETFTVTLASATGNASIVAPRAATVRVLDDDDPPASPAPPPPAPETVFVPVPIQPVVRQPSPGACANVLGGTVGDDALTGTVAGDLINGLAGADALSGRAGEDCLRGGPGNDWINAADGNDELRGDSGEDFLLGGRGNDVLTGGNGDDRLAGGDGNDRLTGGGGSNHIVAGSGEDRINAKNGRRDVIDCGGGRDRASIDLRRDRTRGCEIIPGT